MVGLFSALNANRTLDVVKMMYARGHGRACIFKSFFVRVEESVTEEDVWCLSAQGGERWLLVVRDILQVIEDIRVVVRD